MKKVLRQLQELSIRDRLIIAVVICILLPWISTYIVSNYLTKDVLEKRAVDESRNSLRMVELSINNYFDDIMYTSNFVQFNEGLNKILKSYQSLNFNDSNLSNNIALHHKEVTKALAGITDLLSPTYITILFQNDLSYTNYSTSSYNPKSFYKESWFNELENLNFYKTFWLGAHKNYVYRDSASTPYLITVGRKLESGGELKAYVIISLDENRISDIFSAFQGQVPSTYFLTSADGVIYSSENKGLIGGKLPFSLSQSNDIVTYDGEKYVMVKKPLSYNEWQLVNLVPYQEAIGTINTTSRITIIIQGAFLLLFLLGLIILIREITKPIMRLNRVTKEVEAGNIHARANLSGKHDIAYLGHSFDQMLDTIETMIEQVRIQEEQKRNAEFDMLQAQINPHFLFNTLNAIRLKSKLTGDQDSADMLYALSALLRMTINRNNAFISLEDELRTVRHYVGGPYEFSP